MQSEAEGVQAPHGAARLDGAVYAVVVIAGIFSLAYAPGRLFDGETDAQVVRSIAAQEGLLRASIAAELVCYTAFIVLPLSLYRLLAVYGPFTAMLMAGLAVVSVPFGYANCLHLLEIVRIVDAGAAAVEGAQIMAALHRYESGLLVQSIPWGLWLIPLGYLLIRSGFFPRILGVLLIARGVGYVADLAGTLLAPDYYAATGLARVFSALGLAEILTCVWLLVFGARRGFFQQRRSA